MAPYLQPGYSTRTERGLGDFKFFNKAAQRAALLLRTRSFALGRVLVKSGYTSNRYATVCLKCDRPHPEGELIHFLFTCTKNTDINIQYFKNPSVSESLCDQVLTNGYLIGACSLADQGIIPNKPGLEWLNILTNDWRKALALHPDFKKGKVTANTSRVKGPPG